MTETQAKDKLISVAEAEIGYREEGDNWTKYAAELDPLKITYGNKQNLAWCGEFVLWCAYKAFGRKNGLKLMCSTDPSGIPLCSAGAAYFKNAGRWYNTPQRGDVIFFNYSGGINHTGIVESVSGGLVHTIEGNTSDMVARRVYSTGMTAIAGYGRPRWDVVADEQEKPTDETPTDKPQPTTPTAPKTKVSGLPMLKRGDRGEVVRAAQFLLNGRKCSCGIWGADGDFGAATEAAVLAYQRRKNLEADGIIGQDTWTSLLGVN